jgi:DNA-binding CsgD family transcriptional regulator/tetratricopeptide (TPR) repeat protein
MDRGTPRTARADERRPTPAGVAFFCSCEPSWSQGTACRKASAGIYDSFTSIVGLALMAATGFVGRQVELGILTERFAAAELGYPQVVHLEGEAGSGKSTLLSRFVGALSNAVVVQAGGDEDEMLLSYGVIDQLEPGSLTEPGADPMAIGVSLLDLLDRLQSEGQVVVLVVDDLQWVDRPSSRAVLFALRRLRADKVLTVISARAGGSTDPGWSRFLSGDSRVTQMRLGGLDVKDLVDLAAALDIGPLTQGGAARLIAHTEGNALYCRALLDEIGVDTLNGEEGGLPAPRELSGVILARIATLSGFAQSFLAAASVLGQHAAASMIARVAELADPTDAIDEAVGTGLMSEFVVLSELSFTHPLYRAAIYADLSPARRQMLHARAAGCVVGQARLLHQIAASSGTDEVLAGELEELALKSVTLGELGTAAWALEQAALLSPAPEDRERRLLDAAVSQLDAADSTAAERVLALCQGHSARRAALTGLLGVYAGLPSTGDRLLMAWQDHDPASERDIGARAATSLANWMVLSGRSDQALMWAERAESGTVSGSALHNMALTAKGYAFASAGRSAEGLAVLGFLPASPNEVPVSETDALIMRGMLRVYLDDLGGAIADLGVAAARIRTGLPASYPVPCLTHLSDAHFRHGDWDAANTYAQLATSLAQDVDRPADLARAHARAAQVLSFRGQWSVAQLHVKAAREASQRSPLALTAANAAVAAASFATARKDPTGVLAAIEPPRGRGMLEVGGLPGMFNWRALEADALIGLGRLDDALHALDEFEAAAPLGGLRSAALALARCRGNLAVATGDAARAQAMFERAHSLEPAVSMPFECALVGLDDGRRLRWIDDGPGAIVQFEGAHRVFSALGADPYVQVCAAELATLEVVAATESPAALLGLSRAELAVARLVATGLINREVAAELYVSVKTVEYHLRNIFIKLDITSRRELGALII